MPINFINQKKSQERSAIRLERNCVIENVDPKKGNKPRNELSFALSTGQTRDVWLPQTQYKLLEALASANDCDEDDDINVLTIRDLIHAKERFKTSTDVFRELGVAEFRCDLKAGVVNITTVKGEVLRVDLETKAESREKTELTKKSNSTQIKENITHYSANVEVEKTKNKQKIKSKKQIRNIKKTKATTKSIPPQKITKKRNNNIEKVISKFKGGNIDINQVHDLQTVAKYTGISERYIKEILVGIEGKNNWPLVKAEYDGVKDKTHPKGYLTIGFGHTSLTGEPTVYEGMAISSKQAFQILANDIITAKKYAKYFGGEAYNKAPTSIKNAMIDLVFNKGPGAINENLKANLNKGYFHSAAMRTWYKTSTVGLQKRNLYRFMEACKNLKASERKSAISRFKQEHKYELDSVFQKDPIALVEWNKFCNISKCKEFGV